MRSRSGSWGRVGEDLRARAAGYLPERARQRAISWRRRALAGWRGLTRPRVIQHAGVLLHVDASLGPDVQRALYCGDYERSELGAIRRHLLPSDTVLELGTGLGFVALFCAQRVGAERVHTFEANPELEGVIRSNFALNGLHPRLRIACLGEPGEERRSFFVHEDMWSSSSLPLARTRELEVPVRPAAEVMAELAPTVLILDVEGDEARLLPLLDLSGVRRVALELHTGLLAPRAVEQTLAALRAGGLRELESCDEGRFLVYGR